MLLSTAGRALSLSLLARHAAAMPPAAVDNVSLVQLVVTTYLDDGVPSVSPAPDHCDMTLCVEGTSFCEYWAGITGWDPSKGVVPGETLVPVGACLASITSSSETVTALTTTAPGASSNTTSTSTGTSTSLAGYGAAQPVTLTA